MLVTRPLPAARVTAARLTGLGHHPLVSPLLVTHALAWQPPEQLPQALVLTSASAPRHAGPALAQLARLPAFAVGEATAAAARRAGCSDVRAAAGDASAVFAQAAAAGFADLLHLAGADRSDAAIPQGARVAVRCVYAAQFADDLLPGALTGLRTAAVDRVLLYSARSAAHFAALVDRHRLRRATIALAALSPAVAAAAGPGWRTVAVAGSPREDALFAAAGLLGEAPRQC